MDTTFRKIRNEYFSLVIIFFTAMLSVFAQNKSINFETISWNEVVQKATKENKPIFVDAYATWCGPCKWMANEVFTNDDVADFYNNNFINVKMDMEKGEGKTLAKEWEVQVYPTLIYFSSEGKFIHRVCGTAEPVEFIEIAKQAINPKENLAALIDEYSNGNRDSKFVSDYLIKMADAYFDVKEQTTEYFKTQKEEDLYSEHNWILIEKTVNDIHSKEFIFLEKNLEKFKELYGKQEVNDKLKRGYITYSMPAFFNNDKDLFNKTKTELIAKNNDIAVSVAHKVEISHYFNIKDFKSAYKSADKLVASYIHDDSDELNELAWKFFETVEDPKMLIKVTQWAEQSVKLKENQYNLDTYAHLLFVTGKVEEAIIAEKKAIEIAKKVNDPDVQNLENNLLKFEQK